MNQITGLQAMMAYWERLHPVNAVQVAEITLKLDPEVLHTAVDRVFRKFRSAGPSGGWPTTSPNGESLHGDVFPRFDVLSESSSHPLESLVTDLLNQPFSDFESPFRVGLAQSNDRQYLWLSYRHSIADARSIAILLQNLLEELSVDQSVDLPLTIERTRLSVVDLFPDDARRIGWLSSTLSSLKALWTLHRCHRSPPANLDDFRMTFQVHAERLPLKVIQQRARQSNVTIGELVIASMLEWFLIEDRTRPNIRWSPNRCVNVLVDLSGRADPKQTHLFGQFLAPWNITANQLRERTFDDIVKRVSKITRMASGIPENLRCLRGLLVNSRAVTMIPIGWRHRYQEFLFPVSGAFSNVNLRSVLAPPRTPLPVTNYFRGTCATQFSPMILCLTTINETCSLTSTHRDSVYSRDEMNALGKHVSDRIIGDVAFEPT